MNLRLLVLYLLVASSAAAQVKITATVTEPRGRVVTGLQAGDFMLRVDGVDVALTNLAEGDDLPLSIGVLLDTSGSMERKIARASNAIEDFIDGLDRNDELFLMTFGDEPRLVSDYTDGKVELVSKLRRLRVGGETALYDGLNDAIRKVNLGTNPRKVILLVTDGADSVSGATYQQILRAIRESNILVYCIGIPLNFGGLAAAPAPPQATSFAGQITLPNPRGGGGPSIPIPMPGGGTIPMPIPGTVPPPARLPDPGQTDYGDTVNMSVLEAFANASGARAWRAQDLLRPTGERIELIVSQLLTELREQYVLTFKPSHPLNDRQWHDVDIRMKDTDYSARYRREYLAR